MKFLLFCGYVLSDPLSRSRTAPSNHEIHKIMNFVSPLKQSEDRLKIRRLETRRLFLLIITFLWAADFTFLPHTLKFLMFTRGSSESQSARTSLALRITGSSSQLLTSSVAFVSLVAVFWGASLLCGSGLITTLRISSLRWWVLVIAKYWAITSFLSISVSLNLR